MRKRSLAVLFAFLLSALVGAPALAASDGEKDTDTLMIDAKVVEVGEQRISVVARTGVEHVVAADTADTRVTRKGKRVSFKDLRVGDTVTVELDAANQLKFARRIVISEPRRDAVASARP